MVGGDAQRSLEVAGGDVENEIEFGGEVRSLAKQIFICERYYRVKQERFSVALGMPLFQIVMELLW